jgi:hypothetical protein
LFDKLPARIQAEPNRGRYRVFKSSLVSVDRTFNGVELLSFREIIPPRFVKANGCRSLRSAARQEQYGDEYRHGSFHETSE